MSNIRVGCIWQGAVHALVMFPGWPRPRCTHLRQFNPFKHIFPPKKNYFHHLVNGEGVPLRERNIVTQVLDPFPSFQEF